MNSHPDMEATTSNIPSRHDRVISHFDLDAFYVACERELNPELLGKPVAVSQYNPHGSLRETDSSDIRRRLVAYPKKNLASLEGESHPVGGNGDDNGSMIAVSYEARAAGVQRGDRGRDAVKKCPELHVVQVPVKWGKADLTMYRNASARIMDELVSSMYSFLSEGDIDVRRRCRIKVEKASIDEIYIDMTEIVTAMTNQVLLYKKWMQTSESNTISGKCEMREGKKNADMDSAVEKARKMWLRVLQYGECTTIAGIEVMSKSAQASHSLSKNEVRKGSHLQLENDESTDDCSKSTTVVLDAGSKAWWNRDLTIWSTMEVSLACGSALVAKARNQTTTNFRHHEMGDVFTLSGGISSNKTLAKLGSGLKKPNRQTIINPHDDHALASLFHPLPINRLRGLGGKFGVKVMELLDVKTVGDLAKIPMKTLESKFPTTGGSNSLSRLRDDSSCFGTAQYLFDIARGICTEEVANRTIEKSMSSGKTFRRNLAFLVSDSTKVKYWLEELTTSLIENRLRMDQIENKRVPTLLVLNMKLNDIKSQHISRSTKISRRYKDFLPAVTKLFDQIPKRKGDSIMGMTVSATSFVNVEVGEASIKNAFNRASIKSGDASAKQKFSPSFKTGKMKRTKNTLGEASIKNAFNRASIKSGDASAKQKYSSSFNTGKMKRAKKTEDTTSKDTPSKKTYCDLPGSLDMEVFAQLPLSIQAEIQYHQRESTKKRQADAMKEWLTRKERKTKDSSSPS